MDRPSSSIADRYRLQLSEPWTAWFDSDLHTLEAAGAFQSTLPADRLVLERPAEIWPGFMLPDTLPVIGNEYGDWICARVCPDGRFGELLHWYHGGGDWVPLGSRLAEALLHDVVDQFRPAGAQMLRGATETLQPQHHQRVLDAFANPPFSDWLARGLADANDARDSVRRILLQIHRALAAGDYSVALGLLHEQGWSADAVACDLIETALQHPLTAIANPEIAKFLGVNWTPDYARWLFDVQSVPADTRQQILDLANTAHDDWPRQSWEEANRWAQAVLDRRQDLGWAFHVVGWNQLRSGQPAAAADTFFRGRWASAFSDQSVRLRTQWIEPRHGKLAIAQLAALADHLTDEQRQDKYLQRVWQAPDKLLLNAVQEYWTDLGRRYFARGEYGEAYNCFYRAGWDLGVQRLAAYQPILEMLVEAATRAGWPARAAVAHTHLTCLLGRYVSP